MEVSTDLTVRHVTPGLGIIPSDLQRESCSGLVGVALGIAEAQADRGHRSQVFGWNPRSRDKQWRIGSVEAYGTRGWNWAKAGHYDFRVIAPLLAMGVYAGFADILHAYTDPHLLLSPRAKLRVFHLQTPVPAQPSLSYTFLANRADAVVCCSSFTRDEFLSRVDYPKSRVFEVPNGIDPNRFENVDRHQLRAAWGVDADTPVILFAGAVVPEKGLLYLLQAARQMRGINDFHIVVAGNSALWLTPDQTSENFEDGYTHMVREAASDLPITWLGAVPVTKMPDVYAASDVFVCPSAWDEPFGMVACEAMAAGKPVVASRRGGLSQIVVDGETGILVPSEDVPSLRSALDRLVCDRDLAQRMGNQAKERSGLFTWNRIAAQLDSIYEELDASPRLHRSQAPGTSVD